MLGFFKGEPVVARFGLRGARFTLDLLGITSGTSTKFRGRSESKVCGSPRYAVEEKKGTMEATSGEPAKWNVSIYLPGCPEDVPVDVPRPALAAPSSARRALPMLFPSIVTAPRTRLKIEGRDEAHPDELSLELWESADDPSRGLEPYRATLRTAADIEAVLKAKGGVKVLAYTEAGSRRMNLAELAGSPLSVKRSTETGLVCDPFDDCSAKLTGFELGEGTLALLVTLAGEGSRGQGFFRTVKGELWILTQQGFTRGAQLPEAGSSNTSHGAEEERTVLSWVDGDGERPPEVLVQHRSSSDRVLAGTETYPGWDHREYELFAFDPTLEAYEKVEVPSETPPEALAKLLRSHAFAAF